MNDPNSTIYWQGRYHVFYQYNPDGAYHGNIHWGHASSADLVHWTDHPIALAPTPGGPDRDHCYSGAAFVNKEGVPTFIYHGVPDGICLATSQDDLLVNWEKHPANPIIPNPAPSDEFQIGGAPCAWVEVDTYYAVTGNSICFPDRAYLFTSKDLARWEYLHPFYEGGFFTDGGTEDCGCPDFFPLGNKHVLLFTSHRRGAQCYVGTYANHRFVPERHVRFAFGEWGRPGIFCEGLTLLDGKGRRILFGRLHEARYGYIQRASGWAGMLALPIVLSLSDDGNLLMEPAPELEVLRRERVHLSDIPLGPDSTVPLAGLGGDRLEIRAVFEWGDAEEFGVKVCCSPDGEEQTLIRVNKNPWARYRPATGATSGGESVTARPITGRDTPNPRAMRRELILDVTRSSVNPEVSDRESQQCTVVLSDGQPLELRVFVDRSVVEVFADNRHYLAKRIYPARPDSLGVQVFALGGSATLRSLDAWQMAAIWPV
ncbi:MAG: glycoside hydrolase family 32 protein [Chloroflexi bacterium]|nr:glycoside hydrolase family 32 protein [Chloroflexota bacterium]